MAWFGNHRRKWKKEQKKGIVGPSGIRPVLPGSSLIQPSYQRSFQSTVGFSRSAEIPSVPLQWFPSSLQSVQAPLESALNPIMRATAAEPLTLPCQQFYPPFRPPAHRIAHQYPGTNCVETAASTYPPCYSARNHVSEPPKRPTKTQIQITILWLTSFRFLTPLQRNFHTSLEIWMEMKT